MGPWRLPSVRWPLLLLLTSIGFTTLGVFEANRAIRSQRRVAEHALHDYAGFVAWSYEQHLRELFTAGTQEVLGAVNHGENMHTNPTVPPATKLPEYLPWDARCYCHRSTSGLNPVMYFGYVLGSDTLGVARNTHLDPHEGWEVDRPMPVEIAGKRRIAYTVDERRWINDTLTKQIHNGKGKENGRFPIVIARYDSMPRLLVYTLMPTTWGDTLVYGAEYAVPAIGFPAEAASQCLVSTVAQGWSLPRFAECMLGLPVGAVRASFGVPSNRDDLRRLVAVVESFGS